MKIAIDTLIPQVNSFEELLSRLQGLGYEIKRGKYVSCLVPGQERFTRLKTIGADYTEDANQGTDRGQSIPALQKSRKQIGACRCSLTLKTVSKRRRAGAMNNGRKSTI